MAVADTDVNIFEDTENSGNGGGGGGGTTDVTIYSSRNTITAEEVSPGEWDVNVASESSLRYLIHNFDEFMDASVEVAKKVLNDDPTNCVFQIVQDIDMTSPTAEQASLYRVNGSSLIDITNKRYNFGKYFYRTTIMCDGTARTIQLTYPNGTNLDTWTFGAEWIRMNNVVFGGGVSSYARFPNHGAPHVDTVNFSRYLVRSNGNLNYVFENCEITCCGASFDSFNPFIFEGNGSNNSGTPSLYHTRLRLENCYFFHGADMGGSVYNQTVAPIVIHSEQGGGMERSFKIKQLTKSVGQLEAELGLPNIQIRSYNPGTTSFNNIKTTWEARPWQTTGDGTALISCEVSPECLIFQTKVAVNDVFIQGQPTLQPEGATNTYNWVSLSELISPYSLLQNKGINGLINFHDKKLMTIPTSDRYTEFENYAYLLASYEIYDLIFSTIPISQMIPGSTKVYRDEACTIEYATVYATGGDVVVVLEIEGEIKQYYSIGKTPTYIATTKAIIDALNSPNMAQFGIQTKSVNISQNGTTTISPDSGKLLSEVEVNVDVQGGVGVGKAVYYRNNSSQPWSAVTVTWSTDHYVATPSTTQGFTVAVTDDGNEPAADLSNVFSMFVWTLGATFGIDAYVKFTDGVHGVAAVIISL